MNSCINNCVKTIEERLSDLTYQMRHHDWNYKHSDDYGAWNRGNQRSEYIVRESYELRSLGYNSDIDRLWELYCPYKKSI